MISSGNWPLLFVWLDHLEVVLLNHATVCAFDGKRDALSTVQSKKRVVATPTPKTVEEHDALPPS